MQFTTLSVAFLASMASAHQYAPNHFHHRRQLNSTGLSTTLTVYATSIYTITSCAASITDCPARPSASTSEMVVTDVIALTTTVCPVAEAESASSKIIASFSAAASPTSAASPSGSAAGIVSSQAVLPPAGASGPPLSAYPSGSDSVVLTYTIGAGTSTTVVTTTIKHVQTATVYATIPRQSSAAGASEAAGLATSTGPTTTITDIKTSTRYITVIPASSAPAVQGAASGSASGACVPVTVTIALSTVTVTMTASATPTAPVVPSPVLAQVNAASSSSSNVVVIMSTATVVPLQSTAAPYIYTNGTLSTKTNRCSGISPSSGFISKAELTASAPTPLITVY